MQPAQQQRHVPAQLIGRRIGTHAQGTIAIGIRVQQYLFYVEACGSYNRLLRFTGRSQGIGKRAIITGYNTKQAVQVRWQVARTQSPDA
jgi:hypothetical protein